MCSNSRSQEKRSGAWRLCQTRALLEPRHPAPGPIRLPAHPGKFGFWKIEGLTCYPSLAAIQEPIHTITLYLGPARSTPLIDQIVAANPQRIIMNPGAENEALAEAASGAGIEVVEGCTLVMLKTGLF